MRCRRDNDGLFVAPTATSMHKNNLVQRATPFLSSRHVAAAICNIVRFGWGFLTVKSPLFLSGHRPHLMESGSKLHVNLSNCLSSVHEFNRR